jgi:SAM-dependent methyltransferase
MRRFQDIPSAQGKEAGSILTKKITLVLVLLSAAIVVFLTCSCERGGRWSKEWEEQFESFQPSGKIMDVLGVGPGMVIGEIGAGNGRFAVKVAARVGPAGRVYANDIDPKAIRFMEKRCQREDITNLTVIRSKEAEPGFPEAQLDLVYLINTFDELSDPVNLLRNARSSLKPDGRLAIIVYDPTKLEDHDGHAIPREVVIDQGSRAGFALVLIDTTLVYDNIYIFEPSDWDHRAGRR